MNDTAAPPPNSRSVGRRIRNTIDAYPDAFAIVVYALVAMAATVTAYLIIFTVFAPYDDEGTLLVTLKAFVNGDTLYRDVWSVYGPSYYELFGGLFALTGQEVTTDASRTIVIVIWVVSSLFFGLGVHRLTGRLALGVTGMLTGFGVLPVLANEPMHPQGLCALLLAALTLTAICGPKRRLAWFGAVCGALLAALVLTKVNLGIYAVAAAALAAVMTVGPLWRLRWLRWLVVAGFLALPLLVFSRDLDVGWVRELMLLQGLTAMAVVVAAWPWAPTRDGEEDGGMMRLLVGAAAGFAVAFAAIIAIILLTGPSLADVYEGVITQAFRIRDVLLSQFPMPPGAVVDWAVGALAAAVLASRLLPGAGGRSSLWPGLVRGAAGLAILFTVAHIVPFGLNPSAANPIAVPLMLAWIATIPPIGVREAPYKRFLRVLLPALAVAETLQVYPVAGSQLGIAAVSFIPVGALCLADALVELRAWNATRGPLALERFAVVAGVTSVALAAIFALNVIILPTAGNTSIYRDQTALNLPGASQMHMPEETVDTYRELVNLLHRHGCTTFIGFPNVNSLYLWSGLEAPPPRAPNAWMYSLSDAQQQKAVDALRASPRPCAIRNEGLAGPYLKGLPPPDTPLVRYVFNDFKLATTVGDFEFLLPKASATAR